jgi:ABC-type uncharacterized transport system permease subunit
MLYTLLGVDYGVLFFTGSSPMRRFGTPALWTVVALHGVYLILLTIAWGQFPAATVAQAFSILAFAVALIYGVLEHWGGDRASGFWMLSQAAAFQTLAVVLRSPVAPHHEVFESPLFAIHVFFALLGYASFAVAAGYGFLFLRLYRELKRGRFTVFYGKLPALEVLERMLVGGLMVGFLALSGGLISGAIWLSQRRPAGWMSDPTILVTLATWTLYGTSLLLRRLGHWQGRQTAIASLAGLVIILGSLVLVQLLLSSFHGTL